MAFSLGQAAESFHLQRSCFGYFTRQIGERIIKHFEKHLFARKPDARFCFDVLFAHALGCGTRTTPILSEKNKLTNYSSKQPKRQNIEYRRPV